MSNTLSLGDADIEVFGAYLISEVLAVNSTITELDLSGNAFSDDRAFALARALYHNSTLKSWDPRNCDGVGHEGEAALNAAALVSGTLLLLHDSCDFEDLEDPDA